MYEGATETNAVGGFVLVEDPASPGSFLWHKIEANLVHPDLSNAMTVHRVTCGEKVFGTPHAAKLGHGDCPGCAA